MNISLSKLILLLFLTLAVFSCKKDDPVLNYFKYELIKYEVDEGGIEYYGKLDPSDPGYNYDVSLFSTGIIFDPLAGTFSGTGNIIVLQMYSDSENLLSPGTYTFNADGSRTPFTFDIGRFGLFVNMDDQTGTIILVNSGTIVIRKTDDKWTFDFDCATSADKTIKGSFTGTLDFYDQTGK